ncbi:hypothetical protein [Gordonia polyisoprenivorans]|uniref:hypothetical protein n=1 Tax=Gordonia polyisoprenivorans TaxID=84595 RepID=UPI001AD6B914|nr:hypothetical protein [Gordonia polyisoprenivorans]QTI67655.1 hypothetical protein J6U32_19045 [Gordonia polyisoprenivorans]
MIIEIHRRASTERVKHGQSMQGYEFSHTLDAVISMSDTDSVNPEQVMRNAKSVHAKVWVDNANDVRSDDIYRLPDGLYYRTVGKPLPRKSGLTGTIARTKIELVRFEG